MYVSDVEDDYKKNSLSQTQNQTLVSLVRDKSGEILMKIRPEKWEISLFSKELRLYNTQHYCLLPSQCYIFLPRAFSSSYPTHARSKKTKKIYR